MPSPDEDEGRIVCKCFSATEPYLRRKIKELGLRTISDITNALKAGGGCTFCHHAPGGLQDLLDDIWGVTTAEPAAQTISKHAGEYLSPFRMGRLVEAVIEQVRPQLQADGGDIELVDIKGDKVYCHLSGACHACGAADRTLKLLVEQQLKEQVDDRLQVVSV